MRHTETMLVLLAFLSVAVPAAPQSAASAAVAVRLDTQAAIATVLYAASATQAAAERAADMKLRAARASIARLEELDRLPTQPFTYRWIIDLRKRIVDRATP